MRRTAQRAHLVVAAAMALVGCQEEEVRVGRSVVADGAPTPPPAEEAAPVEEAPAEAALSYRDEDFVEGDANRDPFRDSIAVFTARPTRAAPLQREVVMPRTAVDDIAVIAIVSGLANPSAMLIDSEGIGRTVHRGDYVGRAEVVTAAGEEAVPVTLNWRVDRIRGGEVVLTREDPTAPNRPPLTRVLALHPELATEGAETL